jgi:predicted HAD superfamily Cof-like phosphohydrolase
MDSAKIKTFMQLAGQGVQQKLTAGDPKTRALGAQLLLSEVLEYVIRGLGVIPHINGVPVTDPEAITYEPTNSPDTEEMVDGLADVAYTMYWNECAFGVPLPQAFELVCDNNLEKFVHLPSWNGEARVLQPNEWDCDVNVSWPTEVTHVEVLKIDGEFYAVGKDLRGKVRKPSSYKPVDLSVLVANA